MKTHYRYDAKIGRVIEVPLTPEEREQYEYEKRERRAETPTRAASSAPVLHTGLYL